MQTITSKETSLNQLPRVYKTKVFKELLKDVTTIFDLGCGKYNKAKEFCESLGLTYLGYDKYNRSPEENQKAFEGLKKAKKVLFICSNVLNVINDDETIRTIAHQLESSQKALVTVYEGNKSGQGKVTTKGFQRNLKTKEYLKFFNNATVKENVIITGW